MIACRSQFLAHGLGSLDDCMHFADSLNAEGWCMSSLTRCDDEWDVVMYLDPVRAQALGMTMQAMEVITKPPPPVDGDEWKQ